MDLAVNHALDRARLGLLDLDRLDMVDLAGGRRFGDVNRAPAQNRATCRAGRQFRQCHPNRHDHRSR
jgi:hypothetical protein